MGQGPPGSSYLPDPSQEIAIPVMLTTRFHPKPDHAPFIAVDAGVLHGKQKTPLQIVAGPSEESSSARRSRGLAPTRRGVFRLKLGHRPASLLDAGVLRRIQIALDGAAALKPLVDVSNRHPETTGPFCHRPNEIAALDDHVAACVRTLRRVAHFTLPGS